MAHSAIRPAYSTGDPRRGPLVPHDRWDPERWTGLLELHWVIPKEHPVVIGAGWQRVEEDRRVAPRRTVGGLRIGGEPEIRRSLVAEIVRRGNRQTPVLPGSSLKGAVRQVYELLTPSCILGLHRKSARCQVTSKQIHGKLCPACSLFGALGYAGRLAFGEATPLPKQLFLTKKQVPNAWGKQKPVKGHVRVYDLSPDRDQNDELRKTPETTRAVAGLFKSRVRVVNASKEELGILLLAAGLKAPSSPGLRLGGKKFHGLGAVTPKLVIADEYHPHYRRFENEVLAAWAGPLVGAALEDEERRRAWEALHAAISTEV